MAGREERINFRRCLAKAKKEGLHHSIDFSDASLMLLKEFDITEQKRQQLLGFMQQRVVKLKNKELKRVIEPEYPKIVRKNTAHTDMEKHADLLPTTSMNKYVLWEILRLTGMQKQQKVYVETLESVIQEFSASFVEVCHRLGVGFRVQPEHGPSIHVELFPYKYLGKTCRYDVFLKNRERLKRILFIQSKIMQSILKQTKELPEILIPIDNLRDDDYEIKVLWSLFGDELIKNVSTLKRFHFNISKMVRAQRKLIPKHPKLQSRFLNAVTVLLTCIFNRIIRNSIFHIIEVTGDDQKIPFMKLHLTYHGRLILHPDAKDTSDMYGELIRAMVESVSGMLTMQCIIDESLEERDIPTYIHEEFLQDCINELSDNINTRYAPLNAYVSELQNNFRALYPQKLESRVNLPQIDMASIEKEIERVDFYLQLMDQIEKIVTDAYYSVGAVEQEDCKANLKASIWDLIQEIAAVLVKQHQSENEYICNEFLNLEKRAKKIPKDSEELMEQGVYMTWASTVLYTSLTERIQRMLVIIGRLMDFTTISWEHMHLNAVTVGWLKRIKSALDQYSSIYETYRFEFEERLVNAVSNLNKGIEAIIPLLSLMDYMTDSNRAREYINQLSSILVRVRNCEKQKEWINQEERTFKYPLSAFVDLEELKIWIFSFYHLVKVCKDWNRMYYAWMDGPFDFLDPPKAEETVEDTYKELIKIQKTYRNKLKQMAAENNPRRFIGSFDDPDPLNQPAPLQLCKQVIQKIKDFRPALTLMTIMCNPAMLQRHWDEMSEVAGFDMTPDAGASLRKITLLDLGPNLENYEIISTGAIKELQLITSLKKMMAEWDDIKFKTSMYKDTGFNILTALDDIQVVLDDHIMKTLTMRGSVFVKPYEAQVKAWYDKIMRINATIDEWGKVQAQWLYLLPIFSSKDIVNQMPAEGILFKEVDATYKRYMHSVVKDPRVIETAGAAGLLEIMLNCSEMLEKINEGVAEYLEKKRLYFPRFFFLSNDEMLEILSETKDPVRVQPHLRKCFEAVNKLQFDELLQIHAMISQESEVVKFITIVKTEDAGGSVEKWLVQVEEQMLASILEEISMSWEDFATKPRTDWMQVWPGQVVLAVSQVYWTANMHITLSVNRPFSLATFVEKLNNELQETVTLVRKPDLSNLARITIKALIVIDVHAKDVATDLANKQVDSESEFKWLCQLRYYWEDGLCMVRILNAGVRYACEYLGNSDRLVITPLTDRCYRTLVGAYHLHLNGAPEGPAGTGKTETTKDLAKALAVQCVVFNCSDGLDYKAMGKFFKGLASAGAWACFDEFNRIEIEVLSVVAQQILCIVQAVRANAKKFIFEGTELVLNPACYVCITMNPGYAGRSELPDNLKVLFRTVAMMVPDYAMIGEISLYSYGFMNARVLSVKIVTTYKLCSEQLSSQNHYDYGMRAVKSVLSAAGNNKRAYPFENEDILLLRSIIDVNLAKFLNHDVPLFEGIISDLFPGIALPQPDYKLFIRAMKDSCKQRNLQPRPSFILKVVQTYEMMIVRHGFMIVGEPFAGKTSTLKVLAETLTTMNVRGERQLKVQYQYVNPKSITMGQLYGQFDPVSFEWFDGVVATCFRSFATDPSPDRKWVIFDGPVDAVWVENMNTVLDDSKKLCLISGEVMAMTSTMSMIFEVMDLAQASPATVSRCGMIYMEPATLGWRPFIESWIVNQSPHWCGDNAIMINGIFEWLVDPCLYFIKKNCKQLCVPGDISLVKNMYQIVEMVLNDACEKSVKKEEDFKHMVSWLQATFIYAGYSTLIQVYNEKHLIHIDSETS